MNFRKTKNPAWSIAQSLGSSSLAVAVALIAFASESRAVTVPNPAEGDIFLAFRADEDPGKGKSYLVKIGQDSLFKSGGSFTVSGLGAIDADLTATFGGSWNTRTDLHWSVIGSRVATTAEPVVYATRERVSTDLPSTPWPVLNLQARAATSSWITAVASGVYGYRGSQATANSAVATVQDPNQSQFSRYATQADTRSKGGEDGAASPITAGTTQFGGFSQWDNKNGTIEGDFGGGTSGTELDFYQFNASGVTRLGTFTINDSGVLSFSLRTEISPSQDTDGDGYTDLAELKAGTSPTDASDFLKVLSFTNSETEAVITANTVADKLYHVEFSEDLQSWLPISFHSAGPTATPLNFTDTDEDRRSKPKGFYRVRVVP
jgi:hypothetical protein